MERKLYFYYKRSGIFADIRRSITRICYNAFLLSYNSRSPQELFALKF